VKADSFHCIFTSRESLWFSTRHTNYLSACYPIIFHRPLVAGGIAAAAAANVTWLTRWSRACDAVRPWRSPLHHAGCRCGQTGLLQRPATQRSVWRRISLLWH